MNNIIKFFVILLLSFGCKFDKKNPQIQDDEVSVQSASELDFGYERSYIYLVNGFEDGIDINSVLKLSDNISLGKSDLPSSHMSREIRFEQSKLKARRDIKTTRIADRKEMEEALSSFFDNEVPEDFKIEHDEYEVSRRYEFLVANDRLFFFDNKERLEEFKKTYKFSIEIEGGIYFGDSENGEYQIKQMFLEDKYHNPTLEYLRQKGFRGPVKMTGLKEGTNTVTIDEPSQSPKSLSSNLGNFLVPADPLQTNGQKGVYVANENSKGIVEITFDYKDEAGKTVTKELKASETVGFLRSINVHESIIETVQDQLGTNLKFEAALGFRTQAKVTDLRGVGQSFAHDQTKFPSLSASLAKFGSEGRVKQIGSQEDFDRIKDFEIDLVKAWDEAEKTGDRGPLGKMGFYPNDKAEVELVKNWLKANDSSVDFKKVTLGTLMQIPRFNFASKTIKYNLALTADQIENLNKIKNIPPPNALGQEKLQTPQTKKKSRIQEFKAKVFCSGGKVKARKFVFKISC